MRFFRKPPSPTCQKNFCSFQWAFANFYFTPSAHVRSQSLPPTIPLPLLLLSVVYVYCPKKAFFWGGGGGAVYNTPFLYSRQYWQVAQSAIAQATPGWPASIILYSRKFSSAKNFVKSDRRAVCQEFIFVKCRSLFLCSPIVWSSLFCLSFIFTFLNISDPTLAVCEKISQEFSKKNCFDECDIKFLTKISCCTVYIFAHTKGVTIEDDKSIISNVSDSKWSLVEDTSWPKEGWAEPSLWSVLGRGEGRGGARHNKDGAGRMAKKKLKIVTLFWLQRYNELQRQHITRI